MTEYPHDWTIGLQLADHAHGLVDGSNYIGWGPDPPIVLQLEMDWQLYKNRDEYDKWYLVRFPDKEYDSEEDWDKIPQLFRMDNPMRGKFHSVLGNGKVRRTKLMSQVYTTHGAMFTFDLNQGKDEEPSGMIRFPVPREMSDEAKEAFEGPHCEYFHYQYRDYTSNYGNPPKGRLEYFHPHISVKGSASIDDLKDCFSKAVDLTERGVRLER